MGVVAPVDAPAMASLVDVSRLAFTGGLFRHDARGGEGFGLPLAADAAFLTFGPFGLALAADAPCWAAPPFFVPRPMMVLWCVKELDSKNKLLRFVKPFFAMEKVARRLQPEKNALCGFKYNSQAATSRPKFYCRLFVPPVLHRKMRLSMHQAATSRP
jgi:hypothetical protein